MRSLAFSAIMIVGEFVFPDVMEDIMKCRRYATELIERKWLQVASELAVANEAVQLCEDAKLTWRRRYRARTLLYDRNSG
jgi:hypothetical protein